MVEIPVKREPDDPIIDILQSNGVQYVHMNDAILEPSKVEEIVRCFPFYIGTVVHHDTSGSRELQEESEAQTEGQ
jgi:Helicase-associated putative binding domain, C-terminal